MIYAARELSVVAGKAVPMAATDLMRVAADAAVLDLVSKVREPTPRKAIERVA